MVRLVMNSGFDRNNINIQEGHLGGYIKSSDQLAPSGLDIRNGDPATWSPSLWLWAMSALNIRSVLDVGCGEGHCAAFFKQYGCDVLGVDGSTLALRDSQIPKQHAQHDFTKGSYDPKKQFDMVWCSEFVEHVEENYIDNFLKTFTFASRYILMTFAEPGQSGWHHVNCQPQAYWEQSLKGIGYRLDKQRTNFARQAAASGHYLRAGLVFQKI
jgi:SAM-dependent methyltransferase